MAKLYKPPRVSGEFKKGENGEAQVRGDRETVKLRFVKTERVFSCRRTKNTAKLRPGRWYVALNGDEDEIWNFSPWSGQYKVTVSGFAAKEGEPPVPRSIKRKNKKGEEYPTIEFIPLLEILEPKERAGIIMPHILKYNFAESTDDDDRRVVGLMESGSRTKQLADFLDITGAWNRGYMKWQDNVLPSFEKRILREAVEFMVIVKNGWIDTLYEVDELVDESNDWDDEPEEEKVVEKETTPDNEDEITWELDNDE